MSTIKMPNCDPYCMAPFGSHHERCPVTATAGPDRTGVVARLDALEAAHKGATPGPWSVVNERVVDTELGPFPAADVGSDHGVVVSSSWDSEDGDQPACDPTDAAAIVAEHNAFGDLLAVARGVLDRASREIEDAEAGARYAAEVDQTVLLHAEEARATAWRDVRATVVAALGEARCRCDGGSYEMHKHPFLIHPDCPIHAAALGEA